MLEPEEQRFHFEIVSLTNVRETTQNLINMAAYAWSKRGQHQ